MPLLDFDVNDGILRLFYSTESFYTVDSKPVKTDVLMGISMIFGANVS
jgi:hypothetical protein